MGKEERNAEARRRAEALWGQQKERDAALIKEKEKERRARELKTARLRELRLAKEAADKEDADKAKAAKLSRGSER